MRKSIVRSMKSIDIRYQRIGDAKRFVEILSHPDFVSFPAKPKSVEEEKRFLRKNREKRNSGSEYNFSITWDGHVVGAVGVKIDRHRKYIGEIGYFVDREYWGRGIAPAAVRLIEKFAFDHLQLKRIEIVTLRTNRASRRVAEKCGYRHEGIQRGKLVLNGKYLDACLFAKTAKETS